MRLLCGISIRTKISIVDMLQKKNENQNENKYQIKRVSISIFNKSKPNEQTKTKMINNASQSGKPYEIL